MKILKFEKKPFDIIAYAKRKLIKEGIVVNGDYDVDICSNCKVGLEKWHNYCPKCGKKIE